MSALVDVLKQRGVLLLMLAAALAGFMLLIELMGPAFSSGPGDLMAPAESEDGSLGLPGVGGVFSYALTAVAIVVAVVGLVAFRNHLSRESSSESRWPMLIAGAVALVLIVAIPSLWVRALTAESLALLSALNPNSIQKRSAYQLSPAWSGGRPVRMTQGQDDPGLLLFWVPDRQQGATAFRCCGSAEGGPPAGPGGIGTGNEGAG